ncbi:MAG TPA: efflux RND transporter periplasmic adaptor subunit [Gemmatimonadales bacterium]|nr:efflux RND transporter periplasmic adaptor subunit [Gemmatimonadales bacterium]
MPAMPGMPGMAMDSGDRGGVAVSFTPEQLRRGRVRWAPAKTGEFGAAELSAAATVPGQIVPNEDRTTRVGAPAQGRVLAVRVSPGERVREGQVLVTLQSPEAGMAQSELAKATAAEASERAELAYATSARDRAERLLALKAVPRQEYERTIADYQRARAEMAQAEAELQRARSTADNLGAANAESGQLALRAAAPGVVLERSAVPGTVVEAGAPLVVVTDPSSLWLTMDTPERLSGLLRVGTTLSFVVASLPADTFRARLRVVGAGLDPATRTLPARAVVPNRDGRLKPAMLATVLIPADSARRGSAGVVILPVGAVQLVDGKPAVFLAAPDRNGGARFSVRQVETTAGRGGSIAVVGGVTPGELVVVEGAQAIKAELRKAASPKMEM